MGEFAEALLNFIFPPHCPHCGAYTEERGGWCEECLTETVKVQRLPLSPEMLPVLEAAWTISRYHGTVGKLIRRLKFQGDRSALPALHSLLAAGLAGLPPELLAADFVTAVPLHAKREQARGFNQAELIFAPLGRKMPRLLARVRETVPQYELDAEARRKNLAGAFALTEGTELKGASVLLADDILTTGTTFFECAQVLRDGGAARVWALALASDRG